jgi:hypothetical protein
MVRVARRKRAQTHIIIIVVVLLARAVMAPVFAGFLIRCVSGCVLTQAFVGVERCLLEGGCVEVLCASWKVGKFWGPDFYVSCRAVAEIVSLVYCQSKGLRVAVLGCFAYLQFSINVLRLAANVFLASICSITPLCPLFGYRVTQVSRDWISLVVKN